MLHPLFSTLVQRPDLALDHLSAYGALIHEVASSAGSDFMKTIVAWLVAILAALLFLGLTGTALMLGFMQNQFHWVLVAVPGFALLLLVVAVARARKPVVNKPFAEIKAQLDSDVQALRSVA